MWPRPARTTLPVSSAACSPPGAAARASRCRWRWACTACTATASCTWTSSRWWGELLALLLALLLACLCSQWKPACLLPCACCVRKGQRARAACESPPPVAEQRRSLLPLLPRAARNAALPPPLPPMPQNVLLTEGGCAKVADVGLSQVLTSTAAHISHAGAGWGGPGASGVAAAGAPAGRCGGGSCASSSPPWDPTVGPVHCVPVLCNPLCSSPCVPLPPLLPTTPTPAAPGRCAWLLCVGLPGAAAGRALHLQQRRVEPGGHALGEGGFWGVAVGQAGRAQLEVRMRSEAER